MHYFITLYLYLDTNRITTQMIASLIVIINAWGGGGPAGGGGHEHLYILRYGVIELIRNV